MRRFRRDRSGTTAIEFSVLILPFLLLLFSIIEVCVSFMGQQLLSSAVDDVARRLRTGELRAVDVEDGKLHSFICARIEILVPADCPELTVNVKTYSKFTDVPTVETGEKSGIINAAGELTLGDTAEAGDRSSINQLNALYRWPLITDIMRRQMKNANTDGTWPLFATNTWQNEPYDLE